MSDSTPGAPYDTGADQPAWRERKNLIMAGAVGAAVVVGLGGYFLLSAGGSSDTGGGLVAGAHQNTAVSASPTAAATLPAVYKADPYGNPFAPIYPPAPTASPTTAPVVPVVAATGAAAGGGSAVVPVVTAPTPTTNSTTTSTKTVTVRLVSIVDGNTVTVSVNNGKPFATNVGDTFDGTFSLASTFPSEHQATFNFGDGSPFTLTKGQTKKVIVTS